MGNKRQDSKAALIENQIMRLSDHEEVLYSSADENKQVYIGTIPAGAYIHDVFVDVGTAFNDSGTDTMDVGTAASAAAYLSAQDIATTGIKQASKASTPLVPIRVTVDTPVYARYNGQNNNATTGLARVSVLWSPNNRKAFPKTTL